MESLACLLDSVLDLFTYWSLGHPTVLQNVFIHYCISFLCVLLYHCTAVATTLSIELCVGSHPNSFFTLSISATRYAGSPGLLSCISIFISPAYFCTVFRSSRLDAGAPDPRLKTSDTSL